ncbi:adhesion G-protein coupled receptor G6-like isoform X18 [Chiloscyllium plagiosum]|uniref:adhesion G-protein coupled receptor G6-like isoform X18 n=1 Tax=Chiloscyllium plagiosum TaxID=36176 RepID=UPI001CB85413|nr:adhesion G-protein coupled receptor G6-like isoform X18 [Chiloscyllium plagiosum]
MIPRGTPYCSSDSWMYSKVQISSAALLFLLVTVHQGTCASLKGQKAVFQLNAPDEYGTLSPGANIPSLGSFTLCIDIRLRQNNKNGMVAFTYNTDMKRARSVPHHELGIMIKNRKPIIWLFHKQIDVEKDISLGNWHTMCLTWDGNTREAHVYLNKIHVLSRTLNSAYNLAQNGSLVLGRKHSRRADRLRLDRKIFVGDLYLFRLWDHAKGHQSILQLDCEDGNVITWDSRQWDFVGSILKYDPSLPCSKTVLKSRFKRSGSSTDCDKSEECGKSEGGTQTGTTSSKVTLRPSSTKETSTTPTGISSPPNTTAVSTTPPEISNPPNTTEVNPTPTEISSPPNATEISTTPSEISPPPNTTEINTSRTGTLPRPNRTESSTILTGTSPQPNRTENTTTVTGISPEMNRTGNSFTKAAISPMTENTTTLTVTSSPPNTTENRMTVNGTSSPPNTTGNSFTNATISPETVNSSTVAGSSPPWDRTENRMTLNGTSSPLNTTGNSFTNATISPVTVKSSTVAGSRPPWDRTENRMTLNGTSSPLNTTGDSFTNATISPVTVNSSTVTGSSPPWDRTENTTTLTGTSSPPNTTENTTTLTGTSSPPNTTGNYFTNAAISPMTENSTTLTGTLSPQNTTGNSFTNATISLMTVNSSTVTSLSPPWDRTGNFISDMTTSPETVNMTITGTSSPQNTTGYSFTNMTISFGTGNPVINKTSSSGTGDSMFTNGTSSPQITTVNITTDTETSLPQITTVYTTPSPQNTTASTMTTNETLSTQKITGNSVTNIRIQPRTVYIITMNNTSIAQNTTDTENLLFKNGMTTTTNRTSPSQIIPVNSTIIMMTPPLQNTTVNGTVTSPPQNTTVNGTVTSPPQNTTENPLMISPTDASAVALIVSQLEKILQRESINEGLAVTLINTISNLINASLDAVASSSRQILNIVDRIGEKLQFSTESINITSPFLALAVNKINATAFGGADFSISNITNLQDSLDEGSPQAGFAMIELPSSLFKNLSLEELDSVSRIQFSFHEKPTLFQDSNITNTSMLNSHIIASSVNANISISDLADPVKITFKNLQLAQDNLTVECVFWDFRKNNGSGGWNSQGCTTAQITSNQTVCECNHLTHFGVLLAISREPITDRVQQRILSFITYIGCGLSSICLAMTLVTYLIFEKLRRDYPSKILINLCTALLFLNMVFLIDSWIAVYDIEGLCIAVAALLHYFLLASFTWMSLEALHMYLALVKVFNTYVRKYILKFCILGWGIPIVVVAIILGTGANGQHNYGSGAYGRDANTTLDEFCWINNDTTFYVAAVGYFCIMFLVNLSMFIVVLTQLCQIKSKKHHRNAQKSVFRDMRSVAGLTFLLGITWGFAFFAWGPVNLPFMYLFAIFNTLQGTFIFIFHCAIKENVQKEWRRHLCCGKLTLPEYSDWSITATNNTKKLQPLVQGMSLSSTSNNSLQSTSPLYPARDYSCHPNVNGARL